jgi:hypothetical protein
VEAARHAGRLTFDSEQEHSERIRDAHEERRALPTMTKRRQDIHFPTLSYDAI